MDKELIKQGSIKYFAGLAAVMLLVFLPAGTFSYAGGWLFIALLFIPMLIMGIVLMIKDPDLLRRRLNSKEKQDTQKIVTLLSGGMFLTGFITAGLDHRFGWLPLPAWLTVIAAILFLLSYAMYAEVLRENTYLSRIVEVSEEQKVIDTGLYGVIRHPMYTATIVMFLMIPLVLGSLISFLVFLIYPAVIVMRIGGEEKLLEEQLDGYTEYKNKVRYRLIPYIW